MQFSLFYHKGIQKIFWKTIDFIENLEMTQIAWGEGVIFFASLWRNEYENRYVIHPFRLTYQENTSKISKLTEFVELLPRSHSSSRNDNFVSTSKNRRILYPTRQPSAHEAVNLILQI